MTRLPLVKWFKCKTTHTLADGNLYISDPNGAALDVRASGEGAFKQYTLDVDMLSKFDDQFACFDFAGAAAVTSGSGTLIRLPLRTSEQAQNSAILQANPSAVFIYHSLQEAFSSFHLRADFQ